MALAIDLLLLEQLCNGQINFAYQFLSKSSMSLTFNFNVKLLISFFLQLSVASVHKSVNLAAFTSRTLVHQIQPNSWSSVWDQIQELWLFLQHSNNSWTYTLHVWQAFSVLTRDMFGKRFLRWLRKLHNRSHPERHCPWSSFWRTDLI